MFLKLNTINLKLIQFIILIELNLCLLNIFNLTINFLMSNHDFTHLRILTDFKGQNH